MRFRWTRSIADTVKSYRVTRDRSGRWHIAFAVIPDSVPGPGDGSVVGVDRGVAVSVALSSGELLHVPGLRAGETQRLRRLQRRLARAHRGSHRRARTKLAIAKLRARETDRRRDWVEKTTTDLARRFDTIRVEDLKVRAMTRSARGSRDCPGTNVAQKRGLNREIRPQGWLAGSGGDDHRASPPSLRAGRDRRTPQPAVLTARLGARRSGNPPSSSARRWTARSVVKRPLFSPSPLPAIYGALCRPLFGAQKPSPAIRPLRRPPAGPA